MTHRVLRLLPLLLVPLAGIVLAAWLLGGPDGWSLDALMARRDALRGWVGAEPRLAAIAFAGAYIAFSSAALPLGPAMNLLAGYLFGLWLGGAIVLLAATTAATLVFLVARALLAPRVEAGIRVDPRLLAALREDAFSYVLAFRLVPVLPFFLVNVAAGSVGVRTRVFAAATLIGRIPATLIYVNLGREAGRIQRWEDAMSPGTVATLIGLAVLALLPILFRRRLGRARPDA